jgi:hypothetical protein
MMCHLSLKGNFLTALNGQDLRELFNGHEQNMPNSQIFLSLKFTFVNNIHGKGKSCPVSAPVLIADI